MSVAYARHLFAVLAGFTVLAATRGSVAGNLPGTRDRPILFAQIPVDPASQTPEGCSDGMLRCDYGHGGRIVRLDPDGTLAVLTEGFHSACEFDVSFDGKRILFAGKKYAGDEWNIWEMNADGTGIRQVTRNAGNCRSPAYQSTLYTIVSAEPWYQIMFVSDMADQMNEYGSGPAKSLYSCKMDGSALRRLTMNLSDDMDPFLQADGRVLLASWQRMDLRRGYHGRIALFGVNTDGADYALFCGNQGKRIRHMPCETTGGLVVLVEADRVGWDGAGQLASVTLRRPLYSYRPITKDPAWLCHSPSPLPDGTILVARRPADDSGTHAIGRLDPDSGRFEQIFDDPDRHDLHAKLLAPRPQPDGRSSVVNEKYPTGKLYCLNAYLTDPQYQQYMKPGMINRLRVIEGVPLSVEAHAAWYEHARMESCLVPEGFPSELIKAMVTKRILGIVPVEPDGSFQIEVPADVPIQLQTLDENGMALRTCGWIWAKHREPRGCIGCHEDPELTPENRFVDAMKKPGMKLLLPPDKRRTVDFRRDIVPIITNKCAKCHDGSEVNPALTDERECIHNKAYTSLLGGRDYAPEAPDQRPYEYVAPGSSRTSPLIWLLAGRNTSRPWDACYKTGETFDLHPPPDAAPLTLEEMATIIEWIDLGAQYNGIPEPGQISYSPAASPAE